MITLPPHPAGPGKRTPFGGHLQGMVNELRNAKTLIACTLEQLRGREKKLQYALEALQREMDGVRQQMEAKHAQLRKIDDSISACALLEEQSEGIPASLLAPAGKTPPNTSGCWSGGAEMCRKEDIVRFFAANPGTDWTAAEIRAELPEIKRAHAHAYLPSLLNNLTDDGLIQRVDRGVYRKG